MLGYTLAVLVGLCQCCVATCARRSESVDRSVLVLVTVCWTAVVYAALPRASLVPDCCADTLRAHVLPPLGLMGLLRLCEGLDILAYSAWSAWCPASVSATTNTTVLMVWGDMAQVLIFDAPVEPATLCGAALMPSGMAVLTVTRVRLHDGAADEPAEFSTTAPLSDVIPAACHSWRSPSTGSALVTGRRASRPSSQRLSASAGPDLSDP